MTNEDKAIQDRLARAYDDAAQGYDARRYVSAEGSFFNRLEGEIVLEILRPGPGMRILDLPAGTGRLTLPLAASKAEVVAADISQNMLDQAQAKAEAQGLENVEFRKEDATALPFPDGHFDAVVSFKFFHLIPHEQKLQVLAEMRRVLKPGGRLVAEFNSPFYGGVLAAYRYYFRKRVPGNMRRKCLFPAQMSEFFGEMRNVSSQGVKFPFAGLLSRVLGFRLVAWMNRVFGRIPVLRQLCYVLIIVAEKPAAP